MLFPLYLLLATAMTMLTSLTCDLSPLRGLTNQTFGISVGVVHGQITFEVYGDDFATKKQVCKHLVCVISLWAADVVFLTRVQPSVSVIHFGLQIPTRTHAHVKPALFTPSCILCLGFMAVIVCSIAGVALVSTRVSSPEIDMDDVGCLHQATSTFLIHLGMIPMSNVVNGVLTPNQNSVISSDVPYTPADSTVGMGYPSTSVSNQMHLLSEVFPLEQDNDTNCSPPFLTPNCIFETPLSATEAPSTPVHQVKAKGEEEPCTPVQVCVRISACSFSQANSIAGLSQCVYSIL